MSTVENRNATFGDLRVVETSGGDFATRLAARIFADFGAEVLQVDWPEGTDPLTAAIRRFADHRKKRIAGGEDVLREAVAQADVCFRALTCPRSAAVEAAARDNVRLVDTAVGSLGSRGELHGWTAEGLEVCALSGVSIVLGEPGRPPLHLPASIPAMQAAFHAVAATLVALRARDRDGRGQQVEVAAADVLASYAAGMNLFIAGSRGRWERRGFDRHGPIYPAGFYPCRDGFVVMATQSRKPWQGFLRLMGDPEWARGDPALRDGVAIGWKRAGEVDVHFIPWLAQFTRAELVDKVREIDDLILGPVHRLDETLAIEQLASRRFWSEVDVEGRRLRLPGLGYGFSLPPERDGGAVEVRSPSPPPAAIGARAEPALAGVRVIEFGWNLAGPMVGHILADHGAEVIKVETARRQDFMRHWSHTQAFFQNTNRNKRSVTIDIATPDGAKVVRELARRSDIVFDNFAAGVLARRGLGPDELRSVRPDLVVLSMAMAGQTGPLRHLRGFATTATGFAGLEALIGYSDIGPTGLPLFGLGDFNAAIQAVVAIVACLRRRDRTGEGSFVDFSQIEAATALGVEQLIRHQLLGESPRPAGNAHPDFAPQGVYPTAGDDRWIAITVRDDGEWRALGRAMGSPAWAADESLATRLERRERREEIDRRIAEWTRGEDRDALAARLQEASVAAAPVLELDEVLRHPHFVERGLELTRGEWRFYPTPWHLGRTPAEIRSGAPALGADNEYVFRELLGLGADEVERLAASGAIV